MATTYELIAKTEIGSGGAANIDFTSIPGTYDDLLVVLSQRNSSAGNAQQYTLNMSINGVTTNRSWRRLGAYNGNQTYSDSGTSSLVAISPGSGVTSNTFGSTAIYIPNYAGSTNKSFSVDDVTENNSSTNNSISPLAGLWSSTSAITQLTFSPGSGDFVQYTTAQIYGITKA